MTHQYAELFRQAILSAGLVPPENLIPDGGLHRFSKDGKPHDDSGWYVFFEDGLGGVFGCWSSGLTEHWRADTGYAWNEQELARHRTQQLEAKRKRDAEKERERQEAKQYAYSVWVSSAPANQDNPYLQGKGIQPHGIHQGTDTYGKPTLLIPMFSGADLWNIQTIYADGSKRFSKGGKVSGCYYPIGETEGAMVVCIAEGFATAATVYEATGLPTYCAFNAGNLLKVAQSVRSMHPDAAIIVCGDDDWQTEGNTGKTKAEEAAIVIGASVVVPVFGADRGDKETDFNDMANASGLKSVRALIVGNEAKPEPTPKATSPTEKTNLSTTGRDVLLQRLADMSTMDYDRERDTAAAQLGIRVSTLDSEVKKLRREADSTSGINFGEVAPWDQPVAFGELLDNISGTVRRFIVCEKATADAAALWVVMTWVIDIVEVAPLAVITAPEKRCGKSQMLNVLGRMVCRPLQASNISAAALYRVVEAHQPTLMIDETDAFLKDNEDMRGIINSGHTRDSAYVIRTVGDDHTPTRFSTWGAKALSGIGKLADTLMDRALILQLRRKLPHEHIDRLRHAEPNLFDDLASQIRRCIDDNREAIRKCRPELPAKLNDRAQDNWEPLLAIADVAGDGWPERARAAALLLSDETEAVLPVGTELLHDIRDAFLGEAVTKLSTVDLIKALCKDTEKRWATYNRGKEITPSQLAKRLSEYNIKSKNLRFGYVTGLKGFEFEQFKDTFARYLDGEKNVACSGSEGNVAATDFSPATIKPAPDKECSGVAATGRVEAGERVVVSV